MMATYFSFSRLGSVLKTDLQNARKNMGLSFLLMSCSGAVTYLFVLGLRWLAGWKELTLGGDARGFIFGVMIATLCILQVIVQWNNYLWPLIVLKDYSKQVISVGVALFSASVDAIYYGPRMALAVLSAVPMIIVFLFLQKYIVQSIAVTGIKQ